MALRAPPRRPWAIGPGPLPPFGLRWRLRGPRRLRISAILEVPCGNYLFELRVSAWLHTRPPEPHDRTPTRFSAEELRLARRLALQLRIPWVKPPVGLARDLATQARWLRDAQRGGRRGIRIWLRQAEDLPRAHRRWQRQLLMRKRLEERQLEAPLEAFAPAQPEDEAGKALAMDNLLARQRFLAEVPCLTSREVAALAGPTARNVGMTASRWQQAGAIFAVPGPREDLYPAFQFQDGKPHPTVARVLAELPGRKSPWQVAFWFVSGNGWLGGATPAARLADGDAVVAAARHEAEDIIG